MDHGFSAIGKGICDRLFSRISKLESLTIPIDKVKGIVDCDSHRDAGRENPCDIDRVTKPSHHAKDKRFRENIWDHDQ